jgi:hypothetical protein
MLVNIDEILEVIFKCSNVIVDVGKFRPVVLLFFKKSAITRKFF